MIKEIKTKIQQAYDTEENWKNSSRILKKEKLHIQVIGGGYYKVGNGVDLWKDLPYPFDNHTHAISDVTGLQTALDEKPKYETGTWTPSNTVTSVYDFRDSKYKKIGDVVILTITASPTNYESKDGSLVITRDSFPFAFESILSTFSTNFLGNTSIGACSAYGNTCNFGKYNFNGSSNGLTDVFVTIIYSL